MGASSRDRGVIVPPHSVLVRPHLEHCEQFWSMGFQTGMDGLERAQRRAIEMIKGLEKLSYS